MTEGHSDSRRLSFALFLGAALVLIFRVPYLLLEPRIWAEEGTIYLAGAWNTPGLASLFHTYGFGYYVLCSNLTMLLAARLVPLEYIPYATMSFALLVQMIPFAIVCFGRSEFWSDPKSRTLAVLIILFTRLSGEIWLNPGNLQTHFALITFLILLESFAGASPRKLWATRVILLVAGLTGMGSLFLGPLFFYLFFREKQRERLVQGMILSACLAVQMLAMLHGGLRGARFAGFDFYTYPSLTFAKDFCLPLFGVGWTDKVIGWLGHLKDNGSSSILPVIGLIFAVQLGFLIYLAKPISGPKRLIYIGGFLLLTLGTYVGMLAPKWDSIYSRNAHRYFYTPNVIFLLLLAAAALHPGCSTVIGRSRRAVAQVLLIVAILAGITAYRTTYCDSLTWPKWREEVKKWQATPSRPINIWPIGLQMRLRDVPKTP